MRVALALLTVYILWGSTYLGIRYALEGGFAPFWLGSSRFLVAGVLMYAVLRLRGYPNPTRAQWFNCAFMAFFMLALGNGMVNVAQAHVSSGITAVGVASSALWIALFALLRGEHSSRREWLGLVIGFAGVILLNIGGELGASRIGLISLLISPLAWAFGSMWSRGRDLPAPFMAAAVQMLCGCVMMAGIALLRGEPLPMPDSKGWWAFAYLVVFGSIIGYSAYVWLLHNVRPAPVGSYAYVNPVIAVILGSLIAGEQLVAKDMIAIVIILAGVITLTLHKSLRRKP